MGEVADGLPPGRWVPFQSRSSRLTASQVGVITIYPGAPAHFRDLERGSNRGPLLKYAFARSEAKLPIHVYATHMFVVGFALEVLTLGEELGELLVILSAKAGRQAWFTVPPRAYFFSKKENPSRNKWMDTLIYKFIYSEPVCC